jgi:ankyrin repeat protein
LFAFSLQKLLDAVFSGDLNSVDEVLMNAKLGEVKLVVNSTDDETGNTPLHLAAEKGLFITSHELICNNNNARHSSSLLLSNSCLIIS